MNNCSALMKEHGCKLWFSNFLGYSLLFWIISWVSTWSSFPTTYDDVMDTFHAALQSPIALVHFVMFAGLFFIIPAFLQAAGTSMTVGAISNNQSNIETYFNKGISNFGKMYQLTLLCFVCYLPTILVSLHASFQFENFSFSSDNLLSLLAIVLFSVTGLALIHSPYILVVNNTTPCEAIRESFKLFSYRFKDVFVSFLYSWLVYGGLCGFAYGVSPEIFESLHPMRFFIASFALSLSMFILTYRYFKYLRASTHSLCNQSTPPLTTETKTTSSD